MTTTARNIVKKALQKNGALVKQEDPSADEANDGLDALNDMLSSWSNDETAIYARVWESFPLTGGDGQYTIGTGADLNTVRPITIVDGFTRNVPVDDYSFRIVSDEFYNAIQNKTTRGRPEVLNFDNAFPTPTIRLWPVPDIAYELHIQSEKELVQLTLDTTISLPPGWKRALIYNLAVELAPEYGQQVPDSVQRVALESRGLVMRQINKIRGKSPRPAELGRSNIYADIS
jgi:hypothetical protein